MLRDEMNEQSYEEGIYCAPEGADIHYEWKKIIYYSNRRSKEPASIGPGLFLNFIILLV